MSPESNAVPLRTDVAAVRARAAALGCSSPAVSCAPGLATPMSVMVAVGRDASASVLFRNAEAIDVLREIDTLVIDKTARSPRGDHASSPSCRRGGRDEAERLRLARPLRTPRPSRRMVDNG